MNRRGFLKLANAALAVVAIPAKFIARKFHRLMGDGIADDTEAFTALVRGEPVQMPDGGFQKVTDGVVYVPPGTYNVAMIDTRNTSIIGAGVDKTRLNFVPSEKTRA